MSGVLVTGATQPLGRAVIEGLLAQGLGPVLAVGREADGLFGDKVRYLQVDLSHSRQTKALVDGPVVDMGLDTLVHLAFHRTPGAPRSHKLHVDTTRLLLRLAEQHPTLRRFVHRSTAEVYALRLDRPSLLREDTPLELSGRAAEWIRQRVEADVSVCTRMGMSQLQVVVLRCAEILHADMGSQLYDYLQGRFCFRPMGFDPVLNLLSLEDAARSFVLAVQSEASGVYNIPGADTLTLSRATRLWGRDSVAVPGPLMGPLYSWRRAIRKSRFRYDINAWRFHFNGVLDGSRAEVSLGYVPESAIAWPAPSALAEPEPLVGPE